MPEAVPLADADERHDRAPPRERRGHDPVDTPVVSDLDDLERSRRGRAAGLQRADLRPLLRVAEQQRRFAIALDGQDHARVVRLKVGRRVCRRPQHAHARGAQPPGHPDVQRGPLAARHGRRCRLRPLQRRGVLQVGNADPAHPGDAHEALESARMVGVSVGQHDARDVPDSRSREGAAQGGRVRARVHEHRRLPIADQDGVALTDVHDDHLAPRSKRRSQHDEEEAGGRTGRRQPDPPSPSRLRPSRPERDQHARPDRYRPRRHRVHGERRSGELRDRRRDPHRERRSGGPQRQETLTRLRPRGRQDAARRPRHERGLDERHDGNERDRARRRHHPEHGRCKRQRPCLQTDDRPEPRSDAAQGIWERGRKPDTGERPEDQHARDRDDTELQSDLEHRGWVQPHQHDDRRSKGGQRVAPAAGQARHPHRDHEQQGAHDGDPQSGRHGEGGPRQEDRERLRATVPSRHPHRPRHEQASDPEVQPRCGHQMRRSRSPQRVLGRGPGDPPTVTEQRRRQQVAARPWDPRDPRVALRTPSRDRRRRP